MSEGYLAGEAARAASYGDATNDLFALIYVVAREGACDCHRCHDLAELIRDHLHDL